jgi:carboxymethylenebutenolidase
MAMTTERVQIPQAGGSFGAYLARPEGKGPFPAVIVYMEIFGVNAHIREVTDRVAAEGYVAIAPDYFHRTGPGVELAYDEAGMAAGMKLLGQLRADEMIDDAQATLDYLRGRDDVVPGKIGAMGFCIGGHMTYLTACTTDVQAAASFYGGGIAGPQGPGGAEPTVDRTAGIRGKILCLFGGKDAMIPQTQVDRIRNAISDASVDGEVIVYDEADHGFFCNQRASYNEAAASDAWSRVKRLFGAELKG